MSSSSALAPGSRRSSPGRGRPQLVVVGALSREILGLVDGLPAGGQAVAACTMVDRPGGRGANQAIAAARLGARVHLIGCTGDDGDGRAVLAALDRDGVERHHVRTVGDRPTGRVVGFVRADGTTATAFDPGANEGLEAEDLVRAAGVIAHADLVVCQLDVPGAAVGEAVDRAAALQVPVVLDAHPAEQARGLTGRVAVVHVDAADAEELTGVAVVDRPSASADAAELLAGGASWAAVTVGSVGDLLAWEGGETWVPLPVVEGHDGDGASDARVAMLAVSRAEGRPPEEAARLATAAATLARSAADGHSRLPRLAAVARFASRHLAPG